MQNHLIVEPGFLRAGVLELLDAFKVVGDVEEDGEVEAEDHEDGGRVEEGPDGRRDPVRQKEPSKAEKQSINLVTFKCCDISGSSFAQNACRRYILNIQPSTIAEFT